jgi:hypothetical protein
MKIEVWVRKGTLLPFPVFPSEALTLFNDSWAKAETPSKSLDGASE